MAAAGAQAQQAAQAAQAAQLDGLFRTLQGVIAAKDHAAVVSTADKILQLKPGDRDAVVAKVVAHLKQSEYEAALPLLKQPEDAFLRAYCLYRTGANQESLRELQAIKPRTPQAAHLEAQVQYRLGNFARSIEIYASELKERDPEIAANRTAALIAAGKPEEALQIAKECKEQTYELKYNMACALLEIPDFDKALRMLEEAKQAGANTLRSDGVSQEEIDDELAVVDAQMAYLLQLLGKHDRALTLYTAVLSGKPSDAAVVATASNNIISLRKNDEKLFDSLHRAERCSKVPVYKLSKRQREAFLFNQALLHLHSKKPELVAETLAAIEAQAQPGDHAAAEFVAIVRAAVAREKKATSTKSLDILTAFVESHPEHSTRARLSLAQLLFMQDKLEQALATLRAPALVALRHRPAMVATLVALCEKRGKKDEALAILDESVAHWDALLRAAGNGVDAPATTALGALLEHSAMLRIAAGQHAQAVPLFERVFALQKGNQARSQRLAANATIAAAQVGALDAAARFAAALPPVDTALVDAAQLETLPPPRIAAVKKDAKLEEKKRESVEDEKVAGAAAASASPEAGDAPAAGGVEEEEEKKKKKKKKKKKRIRLPKNYDPKNPGPKPDPERWRPRWQRKKGRKKRKDAGGMTGSQGAMPTDEPAAPPSPAKGASNPALAKLGSRSSLPRNKRR